MKLPAIVAVAMFLQAFSTVSGQEPPRAAIEGIVVRAGTGEPIPGARLRLTFTNAPRPTPRAAAAPVPAMPAAINTDPQGRFVVKDLEPGAYHLFVFANGYVRQEYGQRLIAENLGLGNGTPVNVAAGQTVRDVRISLTPAGNVSGNIRGFDGKPIAAVPIQILKPVYNFRGERTLQSAGAASTDDRGEYRVYWVTPGHYYVLAGSAISPRRRGFIGTASPNEGPGYTVLPTHYPNPPHVSA